MVYTRFLNRKKNIEDHSSECPYFVEGKMQETLLDFHNKRDADLLAIYDHFGYANQLEKLAEEIQEFSAAYKNWIVNDCDPELWDALIEEYADVVIILGQFRKNIIRRDKQYRFHQDLADAEDSKIQRTLQRIEEGYYED